MRVYKPSGIKWLGDIPKHWEIKKIKTIFNIGRGRVISQQELEEMGNYPVYSSQTKNNGILGYIQTYDFDCTQITWTTDGVNAGTIFLRSGKHNCTNVCGTLRPKQDENMSFLSYAIKIATPHYKRPDTNGAKIMNNEMANIEIVYPPLQEQKEIAEFLDSKCEKIQNYIDKKQKLITLLQEKKQALINEAVCGRVACHTADSHCHTERSEVSTMESRFFTNAQNDKKGTTQNDKAHTCHTQALPPCHTERSEVSTMESRFFANAQNDKGNISYKNSGIEYLGLIPHHWEVKKLKILFSLGNGLNITKQDFVSYGIPCVSYGEIHSKYPCRLDTSIHKLPYVSETYLADKPQSLLTKGDFVFADTSEDIEGSGNFTSIQSYVPVFAGYHTIILKPKTSEINDLYFSFLFDSFGIRSQIRKEVCGVKVFSITKSILKEIQCLLPPLQEQKEIAEFLDSKVAQINSVIEKTKKQIELIKEYKNTLINEAVCGRMQLDKRRG